MKKIRKVKPGRYEGDGVVLVKRNLFGEAWQVYRAIQGLPFHSGSYGSLKEALFHSRLEIEKP